MEEILIPIGTIAALIAQVLGFFALLFWLETDKGGDFILRYIYPELYRWKRNEKWRKEWKEEEADKEWKEWEEKLNKDDEKPQQFFRIRKGDD